MHRSIMDSAMWESEPFSRSQAWIDMLMLANHKPGVIFRRGVKVEIPRGGIGKSIRTLAERWSWSHGKVERFFSFLLDEEMVKKVGTKKTSVDTCYFIVNYEKYQECGDENRAEDGKKTGRRREEDGDGTRMEECKNGRSKKDIGAKPAPDKPISKHFVPPTVEEIRAYCQERQNSVSPEKFFSFYESKGWMVGRNKMKNWKAAIVTWETGPSLQKGSSGNGKHGGFDKKDYGAGGLI